jgi:hypothetical protein
LAGKGGEREEAGWKRLSREEARRKRDGRARKRPRRLEDQEEKDQQ